MTTNPIAGAMMTDDDILRLVAEKLGNPLLFEDLKEDFTVHTEAEDWIKFARALLSASKPAAIDGQEAVEEYKVVKLDPRGEGCDKGVTGVNGNGVCCATGCWADDERERARESWKQITAAPLDKGASKQGSWVNEPPRMPWHADPAPNEDKQAAVDFYARNPSAALFDFLHSPRRAASPAAPSADAQNLEDVFFNVWWQANQESAPFQSLHKQAAREIWRAATEIANGGS